MVLRALGLALLVLAACGRLRFDPSGGAPSGDSGGVACAPAAEVCNGIDDDCDQLIDEGCPCTPFTITRSIGLAEQVPPAVWTGAGYVLVYPSGGSLVAEAIDGAGTSLGQPNAIGVPTSDVPLSAAYTGDRVIVTWPQPGSMVALASDATVVTPAHALGSGTTLDQGPFVAWSGSFLGVLYHDTQGGEQVLARYDSTGIYGGSTGGTFGDPMTSLDWYGSGFVMGQTQTPNSHAQVMGTFDAAGQLKSTGVVLTANRTGFQYGHTSGAAGVLGSAWVETSGLWFEPHDASGIATSPPSLVEAPTTQLYYSLTLTWTGHDYVLATTEADTTSYVRLFHLTATGDPGSPSPLTLPMPPSSPAVYQVLVRNAAAGRLIVTWSQNHVPTGTGYDLYVAQLCY